MPNLQQITVRFSPEDMEKIKELAKLDSRPVSNFITWVVVNYIREHANPIESSE